MSSPLHCLSLSPTVPGQVTTLRAEEDLFQLRLTWGAPNGRNSDVTAYEVSYQQPVSTRKNTANKALSYTVTGLNHSTSYSFTVRAFSQVGAGDNDSLTATTLSKPRKSRALLFSGLVILIITLYPTFSLSVPLFLSPSLHPSILFLPPSFLLSLVSLSHCAGSGRASAEQHYS